MTNASFVERIMFERCRLEYSVVKLPGDMSSSSHVVASV